MSSDRAAPSNKENAPATDAPAEHCAGCFTCSHDAAAREAQISDMLAKGGFTMNFIFDASPPFAYSTGLTENRGLPEIVLVGDFPPKLFETVCAGVDNLSRKNPAALRTEAREVIGIAQCVKADGTIVDAAFGYVPLAPENLTLEAALPLSQTIARYGPGNFAARQVVIPDPDRRLPWDAGYCEEWARAVGQHLLCKPQ